MQVLDRGNIDFAYSHAEENSDFVSISVNSWPSSVDGRHGRERKTGAESHAGSTACMHGLYQNLCVDSRSSLLAGFQHCLPEPGFLFVRKTKEIMEMHEENCADRIYHSNKEQTTFQKSHHDGFYPWWLGTNKHHAE